MNNRDGMEEILRIQPDAQLIARVVELGRKSDDGTLTDSERHEYELLVEFGDVLATFKSKIRRYLNENPA